jgi:hypothetical protein
MYRTPRSMCCCMDVCVCVCKVCVARYVARRSHVGQGNCLGFRQGLEIEVSFGSCELESFGFKIDKRQNDKLRESILGSAVPNLGIIILDGEISETEERGQRREFITTLNLDCSRFRGLGNERVR